MKKPKPKYDCPSLFAYQKESGLSVADFCSINNISTSSLYLNKQRSSDKSSFVEAKVVRQVFAQVTHVTKTTQAFILITPAGEISFPEAVTSDLSVWLCDLYSRSRSIYFIYLFIYLLTL
ncbi:MAG: hypothetical protein ACI84K_002015 [Pseudohongiellaceae bacterium]|jgi:hypothetical protein